MGLQARAGGSARSFAHLASGHGDGELPLTIRGERKPSSGGSGQGRSLEKEPPRLARELRLPLRLARRRTSAFPSADEAAGERRGEGEPELDRRAAPSHPCSLCRMAALLPAAQVVESRRRVAPTMATRRAHHRIFLVSHDGHFSGAATGSRQRAPMFAVKCPRPLLPKLHLTANASGARSCNRCTAALSDPASTRPSDRNPRGRDQREGTRAGSPGDARATTVRPS
jgi:hypothetical protein